jgi:hypothetical protein
MIRLLRTGDVGGRDHLAGCGRVPLAGRLLLSGEAGASAPLYIFRELAHGFLRDDSPLTIGKRSLGLIDRGQDFRAGTLTLFPQGKGFFYSVFLAQEAPALNCLAHKRLLVGR